MEIFHCTKAPLLWNKLFFTLRKKSFLKELFTEKLFMVLKLVAVTPPLVEPCGVQGLNYIYEMTCQETTTEKQNISLTITGGRLESLA